MTHDAIPTSATERKELGAAHGAMAADGIAHAVALACQREQVPMLALGVVTTQFDAQTPRDLSHLFRQKTLAGAAGALLGGVVRRPAAARDLWQMKQLTWQASDRLADFLAELIAGQA